MTYILVQRSSQAAHRLTLTYAKYIPHINTTPISAGMKKRAGFLKIGGRHS